MATWNRYRPVIWLVMLGVALLLLVSPALIGFLVLGMAAGVAFRLRFRSPLGPPARSGRNSRVGGNDVPGATDPGDGSEKLSLAEMRGRRIRRN